MQLQMLLAGVDEAGPRLYWIDYLGSIVELPKAAHG
jgi:20S proteasome alpha/beta subunit